MFSITKFVAQLPYLFSKFLKLKSQKKCFSPGMHAHTEPREATQSDKRVWQVLEGGEQRCTQWQFNGNWMTLKMAKLDERRWEYFEAQKMGKVHSEWWEYYFGMVLIFKQLSENVDFHDTIQGVQAATSGRGQPRRPSWHQVVIERSVYLWFALWSLKLNFSPCDFLICAQ